jgi:hypothetical protein
VTLDAAMLGVGGLMGIAVATSCMLGAFVNFVVLAPLMIQAGDIAPRVAANGALIPLNRGRDRQPVVLVVGRDDDGRRLARQPAGQARDLHGAFKGKAKASARQAPTCLKDIELPLWISYVGVPVFSVLGAWVTHLFFGVPMAGWRWCRCR